MCASVVALVWMQLCACVPLHACAPASVALAPSGLSNCLQLSWCQWTAKPVILFVCAPCMCICLYSYRFVVMHVCTLAVACLCACAFVCVCVCVCCVGVVVRLNARLGLHCVQVTLSRLLVSHTLSEVSWTKCARCMHSHEHVRQSTRTSCGKLSCMHVA